jgi:cytochrome b
VHVLLGYTAGALVVFRVIWGLVGTRYARFAAFLYRPTEVVAYVRSLLARRPQHFVGHNPAGAVAIFALLALLFATVLSGWAAFSEIGPRWLEGVHEGVSNVALALVGVHVAGVIVSSRLHRENLVDAMITGYKIADAPPASGRQLIVAVLLLTVVAGLWTGYIPAPGLQARTGLLPTAISAQTHSAREHERGHRH